MKKVEDLTLREVKEMCLTLYPRYGGCSKDCPFTTDEKWWECIFNPEGPGNWPESVLQKEVKREKH